jgi:kynureninase
MMFAADAEYARRLDREDALAEFRRKFHLPRREDGAPAVYLLGNSLGPQPLDTARHVRDVLDAWAEHGVHAHFEGREPWLRYPEALTATTAEIVGARTAEVVLMNALTVNLHLMLASFYRPTPSRFRILVEAHPFPSDHYAITSHLALRGQDPQEALLECRPRQGERTLRTEDIEQLLQRQGDAIALVLFGGVNYYTGQAFDLERITAAAHRAGALAAFDLAHAAGNVPLKLHDWGVDVAFWCSYKYLNAGPGSPGGVFVHERHHGDPPRPRLAGWWGEAPAKRFAMTPEFAPAPGAAGWQVSNPPVLMLAAYRASMEIFRAAGMERLREKSVRLTGYLEFLLDRLASDAFEIITPRTPAARGAQLSLLMKRNGPEVFQGLSTEGYVVDWRDPDVIRVAPIPLTTTFAEVYAFVQTFARLIGTTLT